MIDEELEKKANEYADGMAMYYESAHGTIPSQLEKYLRRAFIAGAEKNGVVWHDLRKNPKDLPKKNMGFLLVKTNKGTYRLDMFINRFMQDMGVTKTIAWYELPKFEGE